MEKEIRNITVEFNACSSDKDKRIIAGRAIPFNVFSPNREGFREMITPEAVQGVIEKSDIFMLYNHDSSKGFLARKNKKGKGCLRIETKEDGVYFEFEAKKDNLSNYVYERVCNGELEEMSWAFTVAEDEWTKQPDGVYDRVIRKFDALYDFSIVDNSYYGLENAVGCKRFAEVQEADRIALEEAEKREAEEKEKAEAEAKAKEAEDRENALADYYKRIREDYVNYLS